MKIKLFSAASLKYWPLMEISGPNKHEYAARHGYDISLDRHSDAVLSPWGECIEFIIQELRSIPLDGWLWFTGSDVLIMDMSVKLESLIAVNPDQWFIIGIEAGGVFNNDSILMQNCGPSLVYLDEVYRRRRREFKDDQEAMEHIWRERKYVFKPIPLREFNTFHPFPQRIAMEARRNGQSNIYEPGQFTVHVSGEDDLNKRVAVMRDYVAKVKR